MWSNCVPTTKQLEAGYNLTCGEASNDRQQTIKLSYLIFFFTAALVRLGVSYLPTMWSQVWLSRSLCIVSGGRCVTVCGQFV